jgi:hypothetical protein
MCGSSGLNRRKERIHNRTICVLCAVVVVLAIVALSVFSIVMSQI